MCIFPISGESKWAILPKRLTQRVMVYICIHPECAQHLREVGYRCNDSLSVHLIDGIMYSHELNTVY